MRSSRLLYVVLTAALGIAVVAGLAVGPLPISFGDVVASLLQPLGIHLEPPPDPHEVTTVLQLRLPRIALALLVGAALAQAGTAIQGVFRNPLADPGLIGVSSGAACAAAAAIVLAGRLPTSASPAWLVLPASAFCGGALATWLVLRLASIDGHARVGTMLLAGLAVNAIAGAGIGLLAQVADDLALRTLTFWMFGSLGKAGWTEIALAAPLLGVALVMLPRQAQALNALLLGEAEAGHLGVDVERLKRSVILLAVLAVGTSVALAGIIGFVGLIVPHLLRLWAGPDHRLLLPASALLGALLLVVADIGARLLLAPVEVPIGILTALVGGPFFLLLLLRFRADGETL